MNAIQALYQLSYSPEVSGPQGLPREAATFRSAACADQAPVFRDGRPRLAIVVLARMLDVLGAERILLLLFQEGDVFGLGLELRAFLLEVDAEVGFGSGRGRWPAPSRSNGWAERPAAALCSRAASRCCRSTRS